VRGRGGEGEGKVGRCLAEYKNNHDDGILFPSNISCHLMHGRSQLLIIFKNARMGEKMSEG